MPLSDHEQKLLAQMEQQLLSEDPRFASAMRGKQARNRARRRLTIGGAGVVVGLLLLVLAIPSSLIWLGVAGFLLMLGGGVYAMSAPRRGGPTGVVGADGSTAPRAPRAGGTARPARSSGFMQRLEQRWEQRRDNR